MRGIWRRSFHTPSIHVEDTVLWVCRQQRTFIINLQHIESYRGMPYLSQALIRSRFDNISKGVCMKQQKDRLNIYDGSWLLLFRFSKKKKNLTSKPLEDFEIKPLFVDSQAAICMIAADIHNRHYNCSVQDRTASTHPRKGERIPWRWRRQAWSNKHSQRTCTRETRNSSRRWSESTLKS